MNVYNKAIVLQLCKGERIGALAMSEHHAGSDVISMKTRADKQGKLLFYIFTFMCFQLDITCRCIIVCDSVVVNSLYSQSAGTVFDSR